MHRLVPALVVLGLTGCAVVPEDDHEEAETTGTSADALVITGITLPKGALEPKPLFPRPPTLTIDPVLLTCRTKLNRFAVLTRRCAPLAATGGSFSARPVFTSLEGTLCEMQWHPDRVLHVAPVPHAALWAIAEHDAAAGQRAVTPLCDTTSICSPDNPSCAERANVPVLEPITEGMGGCSSCAFVEGSTLFAVLPPELASGPVAMDLGRDARITVVPGGAQTFRVDVSGIPSRTSGFVRVSRP